MKYLILPLIFFIFSCEKKEVVSSGSKVTTSGVFNKETFKIVGASSTYKKYGLKRPTLWLNFYRQISCEHLRPFGLPKRVFTYHF